ncbi:MAG TPA: hypothetical protein VN718_08025 [Rhizomicrobium sp.]|nr:hypothetical protein [Rhizomicrobium sp.]
MAAYSEHELRYARPVARAIEEDGDFRRWLLSGTRFGSALLEARPIEKSIQRDLRSSTLKNPYWFNYWCGKDSKCVCRVEDGTETDILFILDYANDKRLGLHIEVKPPGEQLRVGQAESYPRRAACWANPDTRPRTVPPHQDFLTMLVCGQELASDKRVQNFDKVIFHNDIARRIKPYPEF